MGCRTGVGRNGVETLLKKLEDDDDERIAPPARDSLPALRDQLASVRSRILDADRRILARRRSTKLAAIALGDHGPWHALQRAPAAGGFETRPGASPALTRLERARDE